MGRTASRWCGYLVLVSQLLACHYIPRSDVVLKATSEPVLWIMDFSQPIRLQPIEPGWYHHTFLTHPPMTLDFTVKDGVKALKVTTDDSASMLFRYLDIPLNDYPVLEFKWRVDRTIQSDQDPRSRQGDDHPARLYLRFITDQGQARSMEVIWSNIRTKGDYKFLQADGFPHYVARGGDQYLGQWWQEELDMQAIYRTLWPDAAPATLSLLAIFCDSDDTNSQSESYFSYVRVKRVQ